MFIIVRNIVRITEYDQLMRQEPLDRLPYKQYQDRIV